MAGRVYLCTIAALVMATAHVSATFLPLMPRMIAPLVHPMTLNPFLRGPFLGKVGKGRLRPNRPISKPLSRPFTLADLPGSNTGSRFPTGDGSRGGFSGGDLNRFGDRGNLGGVILGGGGLEDGGVNGYGGDLGNGGVGGGFGGGLVVDSFGGGVVGDRFGGGVVGDGGLVGGGMTNDIIGSAGGLGDIVGAVSGGEIIPASSFGGIDLAGANGDLNSLSLAGAVDPLDINGGYGYADPLSPGVNAEISDSSLLIKGNSPLNAEISDSTVIVKNSGGTGGGQMMTRF